MKSLNYFFVLLFFLFTFISCGELRSTKVSSNKLQTHLGLAKNNVDIIPFELLPDNLDQYSFENLKNLVIELNGSVEKRNEILRVQQERELINEEEYIKKAKNIEQYFTLFEYEDVVKKIVKNNDISNLIVRVEIPKPRRGPDGVIIIDDLFFVSPVVDFIMELSNQIEKDLEITNSFIAENISLLTPPLLAKYKNKIDSIIEREIKAGAIRSTLIGQVESLKTKRFETLQKLELSLKSENTSNNFKNLMAFVNDTADSIGFISYVVLDQRAEIAESTDEVYLNIPSYSTDSELYLLVSARDAQGRLLNFIRVQQARSDSNCTTSNFRSSVRQYRTFGGIALIKIDQDKIARGLSKIFIEGINAEFSNNSFNSTQFFYYSPRTCMTVSLD